MRIEDCSLPQPSALSPLASGVNGREGMPDLNVHAPPFDRNPSAWSQRLPIVALALVGTAISIYLALYQWRFIGGVWDPIFGDGSEKVLDSHASEQMRRWIRIPDGALGAIGYFSEAVFGLAGSTRRWQYRPWLVLLFGFDVIPLGIVSVALVVAQGVIVKEWCTLCLVTAFISLILVFLAYDEVWASIQYLRRVWRRTHDRALLWKVFRGGADPVADSVALERS